jgi:sugar/nucleoside kinase (ribokinase family)
MASTGASGTDGGVTDAVELIRAHAKETVYSVVRFDSDGFEPLYVAPETRAMYPDEVSMEKHFSELHDYVNVDFAEIALFSEELLPAAGSVNYVTTAMDGVKILRVYAGHSGVFLALHPDEPVVPLVDIVDAHLL